MKELAQKELLKAGNAFSSVMMRLEGSKYSSRCKKIWAELRALNDELIKDIKKN